VTTKPYGPKESGFKIEIRNDGRFTFKLSAIPQEKAIAVTHLYWGGVLPGEVARMLRLVGPLDAAGSF
jgi:hypothetical protein